MENEHQKHLEHILHNFCEDASKKYVKGQKEHGGKLWEKTDLLDQAIAEAIDQVIYLYTLKEQLK